MGGKLTKEEASITSTGQVNNNVIVEDHIQIWKDGRILLGALLALKIFEILYVLYKDHVRSAKKNAVRNDRNERNTAV